MDSEKENKSEQVEEAKERITQAQSFDIDGWHIELEYDFNGETLEKRFKQYLEGRLLLEKLEGQ